MPFLLDSNAWIGWLRQNQPKLVARIKQEGAGNILLCSVVLGELLHGAERSAPAHRANNSSGLGNSASNSLPSLLTTLPPSITAPFAPTLRTRARPLGPTIS